MGEENEDRGYQNDAEVRNKVIRKEVRIDEYAEYRAPEITRRILKLQFQNAPRLRDVAPHRRVHEPAEKRHRAELEERIFRIAPRADGGMGLKRLKRETDDVKKKNNLHLVPRLYLRVVQDDL